MSKNFLPLISHLIREVSKLDAYGGVGKLALDYYGQEGGKVSSKDLDTYVKTLKEFGMFQPGAPLSCGLTANALCYVFMGRREPSQACSLKELGDVIKDRKKRLIRIDLKGHSYVIEQVDTTRLYGVPSGNVYQSNIAVIGGGDAVGISLQQYLHEHKNPVKLLDYLQTLTKLLSPERPTAERVDLYKKLYTTPSYHRNAKAEDITEKLFEEKADSLGLRRIGHDAIDERGVLKAVNMILIAYGNLSGANEARDIYFSRCWT